MLSNSSIKDKMLTNVHQITMFYYCSEERAISELAPFFLKLLLCSHNP